MIVSSYYRNRVCTVLAFALLLPSASCESEAPASASWELSTESRLSAGSVEGPFTRIVGALRLDDGRYVVADGGEKRISVYDPQGDLELSMGREGDGPGEFRRIGAIWLLGGDTLGIWDPRSQRITHMLPDGTVVGTGSPSFEAAGAPVTGGVLDWYAGAFNNGRIVLSWLVPAPPEPNVLLSDRLVFGLFESDGTFVRVLGDAHGMRRIVTPRGSGPFAFSPYPWSAMIGDTMFYTNGLDGRISLLHSQGDSILRSFHVDGHEITLAAAWDTLEAALPDSERMSPLVALARQSDRSLGEVPRHSAMLVDTSGLLWLKDYDLSRDPMPLRRGPLGDGGQWTIVTTAGTLVATISIPRGIIPLAVYGDEMLAIALDSLDVERFVVHRVIR